MSGFERLKGPVYAGSDRQGLVNAGFVRTAKGVFVVDTLVTPEDGRALLEAALAESGSVTALVFTHEHGDHTIGSVEFPPCGVLASEGTARAMAAEAERLRATVAAGSAGAAAAAGSAPPRPKDPTLVFDSTVRLTWGPEIVLVELGGHAEGSTVVYIPEHKVLFTGDLVFNKRAAWVGGMRLEQWLAALRTLEGWEADVVVPGHGPVGGKEVLAEQRSWLERFAAQARALREGGEGLEAAAAALAAEFGFVERQMDSLKLGLRNRFGFGG